MMRPFWCFTVDINSSLSSFDTISATGASENAQDTTWVTQFNPNITESAFWPFWRKLVTHAKGSVIVQSAVRERENLFWRQDGLLPLHPVVFKFDNWREVKGTDLQNCRTLFRRRESKSMHFTAILSFISASTALFCKETKIQTRKVLIKTQ